MDSSNNSTSVPRPPSMNSIPGMINAFQNEWDAFMAEHFELKKHVELVRTQLAHSLYQHDAACRVIARLTKERDGALEQLRDLQEKLSTQAGVQLVSELPKESEDGLNSAVIEEIKTAANALRSSRKNRQHGNLSTTKGIESSSCDAITPLHSSTTPGITSVCTMTPLNSVPHDIALSGQTLIATGGSDAQVLVYDMSSQTTVSKGIGHTKAIRRVRAIPNGQFKGGLVSCSDDKTIRVWAPNNDSRTELETLHVLRLHKKEVVDVDVHPCGKFAVSVGKDDTVVVWDLKSGSVIRSHADLLACGTCVVFHPDGLVFATGMANGEVTLWDFTSGNMLPSLAAHTGEVASVAFSEVGSVMATSGKSDGLIKIWDLRKATVLAEVNVGRGYCNGRIIFDYSGEYLIATGSEGFVVCHLVNKNQIVVVKQGTDHGDKVADVAVLDRSFHKFITCSMDRTVRTWKNSE